MPKYYISALLLTHSSIFFLSSKWHRGLCLRATSEEELAIIIIRAAIVWLSTVLRIIRGSHSLEQVKLMRPCVMYWEKLIVSFNSPATMRQCRNPQFYSAYEATTIKSQRVRWVVQNCMASILFHSKACHFPFQVLWGLFAPSFKPATLPRKSSKRRHGITALSLWQQFFLSSCPQLNPTNDPFPCQTQTQRYWWWVISQVIDRS